MTRRNLVGLLAASAAHSLYATEGTAPRPVPEFQIDLPGNQHLLLSKYRGKLICVEGLYTTCPHCMHEAELLSKLYTEYGPRGFQPIGVAFNPMAGMLVPDFVTTTKANFPVGWVSREAMASFLAFDPTLQIYVPQVALVDAQGKVREQTPPHSDAKFTEEAWLRQTIEKYLPPARSTARRK